jgi:hypothetical protein
MRPRLIAIACVLAGAYYLGLVVIVAGMTEIVLPEEITFSVQANTVLHGNTPLFFHSTPGKNLDTDVWLQPIGVYTNALVQMSGPRSHPGRFASMFPAAANVLLVFVISYAIAGTAWAAIAAAMTLIFTPGNLAVIGAGTDSIYPATFVLLWLFGLVSFLKRDSVRALCGAAIALGLCVYAHPTGPLTALFLWMLTLGVTWRRNRLRLFGATLVFMATWAPAAAWFYLHPNTYPDTFGRWFIFAAHIRNPLDGLKAFVNSNTLGVRTSHYWGFWDPSWLFFNTDGSRSALPLLAAPFLVLAVFRARQISRDAMPVLIGAALIVPLAGATFGVPHYLNDAAAVLPLLAILCGLGVDQLVAVLTRRYALQDDVAVTAVDGWHDDDVPPRT